MNDLLFERLVDEGSIPSSSTILEEIMGARVRRYVVSPQEIHRMLKEGNITEVVEGIPKDSKFRGFSIDPISNCIVVFVENEKFEIVPEGGDCPRFDHVTRVVDGKALKVYRRLAELVPDERKERIDG